MDLFDLNTSFASYVPVQARSHPLLKHAACAYAAKQLGRAKRKKAIHGGICSHQASMEIYDDQSIDWEWEGAFHYDRSNTLLMETMQEDPNEPSPGNNDVTAQQSSSRFSNGAKAQLGCDEVVAATAILCVY